MGGTRFLPMSITAIRLLIAVVALMHAGTAPWTHWAGALADFYILAWAVAGLGGFLLGLPRTKPGLLMMLGLDAVFAFCLLLRDAPIHGLLLLFFGGILWRAFGGRLPINPILLPYLIIWAVIWSVAPQLATHWMNAHPNAYDYIGWSVIMVVLAAVIRFSLDREARLAGLSSDAWIDPILSTGEPFTFDFSKWTERVAALYGGKGSICFIGLLNRSKGLSLFVNTDLELNQPAMVEEIAKNGAIPGSLSIARDLSNSRSKSDHGISQYHYLFPLMHCSTIITRRFSIGTRKGLLVIANSGQVDAILLREMSLIDGAFNDVVARATRVVEMRTAFLVEAREVARRDLHDGVLQSLAAIRMRLLTMLQTHSPSNAPICADIRSTAEIVALEQSRLRALLQETMDEDLPINLVEMLKLAIRTIALQWEIAIDFRSEEEVIPMHRESSNNVELLIREIVANASKHTRSLHLTCLLAIRDSDLVITLKDISHEGSDGRGCKDGAGPLSSSSLKQRLAIVNGRAYSEGLSGGTLLSVAVPMTYEER